MTMAGTSSQFTHFKTKYNFFIPEKNINIASERKIEAILEITVYSQLSSFMLGACFVFIAGGGFYLLRMTTPNRLQKLLGYIFIFFAGLFLKDLLFIFPFFNSSEYLYNLSLSIDNLSTPICALYVLEVLRPYAVNPRTTAFSILPFILFIVLYAVTRSQTVLITNYIFTACYAIVVCVYFLIQAPKYNKYISENYSYIENIYLNWIYKLLMLFAAYILAWLTLGVFTSNHLFDTLYYTLSLFVWIVVFATGFKQEPISIFENACSKKQRYELPDFTHNLTELMTKEQLFLNNKLTICDLANSLNTNRSYLSDYLNNVLETTFFDYINHFRCEYAANLLEDSSNNDTLEMISEKAGFNSLSTFRRAFTKKYNNTPSEYRKEHN